MGKSYLNLGVWGETGTVPASFLKKGEAGRELGEWELSGRFFSLESLSLHFGKIKYKKAQ